MDHTSQQLPLARLLDLNNRVHDIEGRMRLEPVPLGASSAVDSPTPQGQIAEMQEEMDRGIRASLVTCWLGMPD